MTSAEFLQLRADVGVSRRALADLLGVSERTVARWEDGDGSPTGLPLIVLEVVRTAAALKNGEVHRLLATVRVNGLGRTLRDLLAIVYG
jgi:DNA-binding XRE family transcriptional regulator